jgi:hypothetical protein
LSFDTATGVISGTPTDLQSPTDYEVTATNSGGSTSLLSIEIIDAAPSSLSYSTPNVFTINESIMDLQPTVSGENLVFSIVPSLPNGLSFDTATGIISGTPTHYNRQPIMKLQQQIQVEVFRLFCQSKSSMLRQQLELFNAKCVHYR